KRLRSRSFFTDEEPVGRHWIALRLLRFGGYPCSVQSARGIGVSHCKDQIRGSRRLQSLFLAAANRVFVVGQLHWAQRGGCHATGWRRSRLHAKLSRSRLVTRVVSAGQLGTNSVSPYRTRCIRKS